MITLLHNASCSKSNGVLAYLEAHNIAFEIRDYRQQPLNATEIKHLLGLLNARPLDIIRQKDRRFQQSYAGPKSDAALIQALVDHPELLERPILITGDQAVIGRPFEAAVAFCERLSS